MEILVLGVSHESAPAGIRDALAMEAEEVSGFLHAISLDDSPVSELVVLSTCNRTEFYATAADAQEAGRFICDACDEHLGVAHIGDPAYAYVHRDTDAVRHLFRVAAGLESLLLGEHQILGQVREALSLAEESRTAGITMTRLFQGATSAGNRARTETGIARGAMSVALAAVRMADKVLGDLSQHRVLVVGAGETGQLVARHFAKERPADLLVTNRTYERAASLAAELGGTAIAFEDLDDALATVDVVVSATAASEPVITRAQARPVLKRRRGGPLVIVDIASPRDVEPSVGSLGDVFLYDLDTLESIVAQNRAAREHEIPKAERVLDDGVTRFTDWYRGLQVTPMIRAFRDSFARIAAAETERHAKHFESADRERLQQFAGALINKLLHHPTTRIKQVDRSTSSGLATLAAVEELFELGNGGSGRPDSHPESS
jgi:glutamyl-tRNA reductase